MQLLKIRNLTYFCPHTPYPLFSHITKQHRLYQKYIYNTLYQYTHTHTHVLGSRSKRILTPNQIQATTITNESSEPPKSSRLEMALRPSYVRSKCRCPDGMHIGQKELTCSALKRIKCDIRWITYHLIIRVDCTRSHRTGAFSYSLFFADQILYFKNDIL